MQNQRSLTPVDIIENIQNSFNHIYVKEAYSEHSLFYNPNRVLPNGMYFATIKEQNGPNDKASNLDRPNVFRFSFQLDKVDYETLFGKKPKRPTKGAIVNLENGFTALNTLNPHPIYAWMHYVCINNPTVEMYESQITPYLEKSYKRLELKFKKKMSKS